MKLFLLFVLCTPFFIFSQSRDFKKLSKSTQIQILTDTYKSGGVSEIVSLAIENGYELYKNDENEVFSDFNGAIGAFKSLKLIKKIEGDFFPSYSIGLIIKNLFFNPPFEKGIVFSSITQISLLEYENVSSKQIDNFQKRLISFLDEDIRLKGLDISKTNVYNSPFKHANFSGGQKYSFTNKIKYTAISGVNKIPSEFTFKVSKRKEFINDKNGSGHNHHYLIYETNSAMFEEGLSVNKFFDKSRGIKKKTLDNLRFNIGGENIKDINIYDLKEMINLFLKDCKLNNVKLPDVKEITSTFEPLDDGVLAIALGMFEDNKIIIKVNPKEWSKASDVKRWYILYHELGHDVLNLKHGEGGKMMFNYSDKEYTWDDFFIDKEYMFNSLN